MSNGASGCGSTTATFSFTGGEHDGEIGVASAWSSSANWVELNCHPHDGEKFAIYLDLDNGSALELALALLEAVGTEQLPTETMVRQLESQSEKLSQRRQVRQLAEVEHRNAMRAAENGFRDATADQVTAYVAAVEAAGNAYQEKTGERMGHHYSVNLRPEHDPFR